MGVALRLGEAAAEVPLDHGTIIGYFQVMRGQ